MPHRAHANCIAAGIVVLCIATATAHGGPAPIYDSAADAQYNAGWISGSNGGAHDAGGAYGFDYWVLNGTSGTAFFTGSSATNGNAPSGNIDTTGRSWGMSAAPGETASANRRLLNGHPFGAGDLPLLISQQLGVDFDNGLMQAGGSAGLYVRDSGVNRLGWRASSGATDYILTDAAGDHDSGIPLTTNGQHLEFTLTGPATYTLDVTPTGGTTSHFTGLLSGIQFGQIDEVQLFDSGAGTAPANDVYFNNLSFTPEPSFAALIGTAASLLASRHSCRKMR